MNTLASPHVSNNYRELAKVSGTRVALNIETTGPHWWQDNLIGLGIYCPDTNFHGYFPCDPNSASETALKTAVRDYLGKDTWIIGHNLKKTFHFLDIAPAESKWRYLDIMIMVHLLDSRLKKTLDDSEKQFLGKYVQKPYMERTVPKRVRKRIWLWDANTIAPYCINKAYVIYELARILTPEIHQMNMWSLFLREMAYLDFLWRAEHYGFKIDVDYLTTAKKNVDTQISVLETELYDSVGYEFNWRSPKQLSQAIYEGIGFPRPENPFIDSHGIDRKRVASRALYNGTLTSQFMLNEIAKHPLAGLISDLRESYGLSNRYIKNWLKLADSNGVIHPTYKLTGTRTGRLSCEEPNLQNVPNNFPVRLTSHPDDMTSNTVEYNLRRALIAHEGHKIVASDWAQMELRMLAILSKDELMLDYLISGGDIHSFVAEKIWGTSEKRYRKMAKAISFGLIYGTTAYSLHLKLDVSVEEAQKMIREYFNTFPKIKPWLDSATLECKLNGFVRTWDNRIWREENTEHMWKGANALIQGGCAGITAIASLRIQEWLNESGLSALVHVVNIVHDEIVLEVPDELVPEVADNVSKIMKVEDLFQIEWPTDVEIGPNYGDIK